MRGRVVAGLTGRERQVLEILADAAALAATVTAIASASASRVGASRLSHSWQRSPRVVNDECLPHPQARVIARRHAEVERVRVQDRVLTVAGIREEVTRIPILTVALCVLRPSAMVAAPRPDVRVVSTRDAFGCAVGVAAHLVMVLRWRIVAVLAGSALIRDPS